MASAVQKIVNIELDESSLVRRLPMAEHERKVAIYDLLEENTFAPAGETQGPYSLHLRVEDHDRLVFDIRDADDGPLTSVTLSLRPLRRVIRDYFQICESYYLALNKRTPIQIETIDMARRGLHNEGSAMLADCLEGKIAVDEDTARRLFTLICVLHIRS